MTILSGMKKGAAYTLLLLLSVLVACEKKSISFGEEFAESFTNIIEIDTVTVALSTYKLDSFSTSQSGVVTIGKFTDPVFGITTTSSYQQVGRPYILPDISSNAVYDSLTLILTPNGEYYGDTTLAQQINVHELAQTLAFAPEKNQLYNTNSFSYNPTPLGSKLYNPRPGRKDTVEIHLSDIKGNELFTKLKNKESDVTAQEDFLRYFKGLALIPSSSSSAIMNFRVIDSAFKMRLYYHEPASGGPVKQYTEFPVVNTNLQFNQIAINRTTAPLNTLPVDFPEVASTSLGNKGYLQDATGLYAKVTFPSLQELFNIDSAGKILKAELIVKPVPGSYDKTIYRMPPTINLSVVDKRNAVVPTNSPMFMSANLTYDDLFGEATGYTFDITAFLQQQVKVNQELRNGLLLFAPSASSFNRLIISDKTTGKYGIRVKIYYLVVK